MLSETQSAALSGIEALPVQVEVNTHLEGEPKLLIVGQINLIIPDGF